MATKHEKDRHETHRFLFMFYLQIFFAYIGYSWKLWCKSVQIFIRFSDAVDFLEPGGVMGKSEFNIRGVQ